MPPLSSWSSTGSWWGGAGTGSAEREGTGPSMAPREGLGGETGPSTLPGLSKDGRAHGEHGGAHWEKGPQAPPPGRDWLVGAGKNRSVPERAECEERERGLGTYEGADGKSRSVPESAEGPRSVLFGAPRSASFSGRTRSGPENAEAGSKRRNELISFRKKPKRPRARPSLSRKSSEAPNRPFRRPPRPPRPSGDPRSDSGNSGSGSKAAPADPEAVPQPPKRFRSSSGSCQATPEFAERFRSRPEVPEAIPETHEAAPKIAQRF